MPNYEDIDGEVIEVVDGEVVDIIDGDEVEVSKNSGGPNLNFNINEEEITGKDLAYGYTLNESFRENALNIFDSDNSDYSFDFNEDENKEKFKTLIYINKKTVNTLNRELETLKKEIIEAYELAFKSSATVYQNVYGVIVGNSKNTSSELNTIIGNTIYFYNVHNLSVDNICDNLSLRLAFNNANGLSQSSVRVPSSMRESIEAFKYHMQILVPIVLDKLTGSWYETELNQLDTLMGLLTPTLFKSYTLDQLNSFYTKETVNSFASISDSEIIDTKIIELIISGLEMFKENATEIDLDSNFCSEDTAIEFLESLIKENVYYSHIVKKFPSLGEILKFDSFSKFCDAYGIKGDYATLFAGYIKVPITKKIEENISFMSYRYKEDRDGYHSSLGSNYSDLVIPELYKSWSSIYRLPFSDREVINIFLMNYKKMCLENNLDCSLPDNNVIDYLLSDRISIQEYLKVMTFLNKAIYSRRNPITVLGEYVVYIQEMHSKLDLPEPKSGTGSESIYDGIEYLSEKVSIIDKLTTNSLTKQFTINCDCGIISENESLSVSDYLTTIRIDPNRSGDSFDFDFESVMEMNITFAKSNSEKFSEIGQLVLNAYSSIDQTIVVCPECNKIHMFSESQYRALDICAQKFLSERLNSDVSKFVQRCTLSEECITEFSNEFYSYFESRGISNNSELPLNLPEVEEMILEEDNSDTEDFSQFNILATEFINNLSKNKEQYQYESHLDELNIAESEENSMSTQDIATALNSLSKENLEKSERFKLSVEKDKLDLRYYNNFIWYFLSNNLVEDLSVDILLKLRISEIMGEKKIRDLMDSYNSMKKILKEIGKLQFLDIASLNNGGTYRTVDLTGEFCDIDIDIKIPSGDENVKQCYKYINLAKRAYKSSESLEEFKNNLELCNIQGKLLDKSIKDVLIEEYQNGNFEYTNQDLINNLSNSENKSAIRSELFNELNKIKGNMDSILSKVDFIPDKVFKDYYTEFDLNDMCVILGCHSKSNELKEFDFSSYLDEIERMGDKFLDRLVDLFNVFDEGASNYLNYLLSTVKFDFKYEDLANSEVFRNLISNYGLICREYIQPSEIELNKDGKLTDKLKSYCIAEICNHASCKFLDDVLRDVSIVGVNLLINSIELDFKEFAFRIMEVYPVDLYNPRLVNSILGKGLSKLLKALSQNDLDPDTVSKVLKSFPSRPNVFPRVNANQSLFNYIKNEYSGNKNRYCFKILDSNGNIVNNPNVLDKVRYNILAMFVLMDINTCLDKDGAYEKDIFKTFNMTFNLPSTFLGKGLKEEVENMNFYNKDMNYDYLYSYVGELCESEIVSSCVKENRPINFSLEKNQIEELTVFSKLNIDTSIIPYRASSSLISSELSLYK